MVQRKWYRRNSWHLTACYRWRKGSVSDWWCLQTNEEIMNTHTPWLIRHIYICDMACQTSANAGVFNLAHTIQFIYWAVQTLSSYHVCPSINGNLQQPLSATLLGPTWLVGFATVQYVILKIGIIFIVFVLFESICWTCISEWTQKKTKKGVHKRSIIVLSFVFSLNRKPH